MLVKFTTKGKPTLINVNHIVGVRMDTEQKSGDYMSKIFLSTSLMVFVDEPMDEVHKIINDALSGVHVPSYDYEVPSVDDRFQGQYNTEYHNNPPQYDNRRGRPMQRGRSHYNNYNDRY